jgi:hypothetical protein
MPPAIPGKTTTPIDHDNLPKEITQENEQWAAGIKQQQHSIHSTVLEAYGFVGDIVKSRRHNAYNHLATMPHWYYFNHPTHFSFHDFTTTIKPRQNLRRLLGLGHKFTPTPRWTQNGTAPTFKLKTLKRFERDLQLVGCFGSDPIPDNGDYNKRLYIKSEWTPPPWKIPAVIKHRFPAFEGRIKLMFKKKHGTTNLHPFQRQALTYLQSTDKLLVVQCDKNLGPATIETTVYIDLVYRDHLSNRTTYTFVPPDAVASQATCVKKAATTWIKNAHAFLSPLEVRCLNKGIRDNKEPFPVLYVTLKAHTLPALPFKSRPIMSANCSLLFGIGIWLDDQLKVVAQLQRSFFKRSANLQKKYTTDDVPDNVTLFTADAVFYYTNIPTGKALRKIAKYLRDNTSRFPTVPINATIEALEIIMCNNFFTFGDTTWIQNDGTAMGTSPAPSYITIYYGIH